MKTILAHLKAAGNYSEEDMANCKQFISEQKSCDVKYEWKDGDETVPQGWKLRVSEGEAEWQWMLSPDGRQFRSRYSGTCKVLNISWHIFCNFLGCKFPKLCKKKKHYKIVFPH